MYKRQEVDPATLQAGDIITFQSTNPASYGESITHKIRALTTDASGNPGFITYGTTTGVDDEMCIRDRKEADLYRQPILKTVLLFFFCF